MALQGSKRIDGRNLHIDVLSGFDLPGSGGEDGHSDGVIVPRN